MLLKIGIFCNNENPLGAAFTFFKGIKIITLAASLGGVESLAQSPTLFTHKMIPKEQREKIGITDGLIRLSIGLEEVEDLINDIDNALEAL